MSTTHSQQSLPCGQGSDYTLPVCESNCPFSRDFFVKTCSIRNMNLTQHSDNQSWSGSFLPHRSPKRVPRVIRIHRPVPRPSPRPVPRPVTRFRPQKDYTGVCESDCPFSRDLDWRTCSIRNMNLTQHSDNQSWSGSFLPRRSPKRVPRVIRIHRPVPRPSPRQVPRPTPGPVPRPVTRFRPDLDYTDVCESDCPFSRDLDIRTCSIRNMNLTQHSDNQSWSGSLPVMCQPQKPGVAGIVIPTFDSAPATYVSSAEGTTPVIPHHLLKPFIPTFDSAPPTYVSSVKSTTPVTPQPPRRVPRVIYIRRRRGPAAYPPRTYGGTQEQPVPKSANPPIDTPWDALPIGMQPAFIHNDPSLRYQHSFTSLSTDVDRSSPHLSSPSDDTAYPDSADTTLSQHSFTSDEAFLADEETTSLIIHRPECPQPPPNTPESTPPPTQQPQPSILQRCWTWIKSFFT